MPEVGSVDIDAHMYCYISCIVLPDIDMADAKYEVHVESLFRLSFRALLCTW